MKLLPFRLCRCFWFTGEPLMPVYTNWASAMFKIPRRLSRTFFYLSIKLYYSNLSYAITYATLRRAKVFSILCSTVGERCLVFFWLGGSNKIMSSAVTSARRKSCSPSWVGYLEVRSKIIYWTSRASPLASQSIGKLQKCWSNGARNFNSIL